MGQGINLSKKLHQVTGSGKEFNGLPHVFVSSLGRLAYAEPEIKIEGNGDENQTINSSDLRSIQCMS